MGMTITSDVFAHEGMIPSRYTCEGDEVSPSLAWAGVAEGTTLLVLIVDDPDAPARVAAIQRAMRPKPTASGPCANREPLASSKFSRQR